MTFPDEVPPLHTLFPIFSFVAENVFLTKSGEVGVVLQLEGIDAECLTDETLEDQHRQLVAAERPFDEQFTTYQYLVKLDHADVGEVTPHPDPVIQATVRSRLSFLRSENGLASLSLYRVILYHPRRAKDVQKNAAFLLSHIRALMESANHLLGATMLAKNEAFSFFRFLACLDPETARAERLKYDDQVDYWMGSTSPECGEDGSLPGREVLTLRDLPRHTWPNVLADLLKIRGNFALCSEYRKLHTEKVVSLINQKQQHFDAARFVKNIPSTIQMILSRGKTDNIVPDASAAGDVDDLSTTIERVNNAGDSMGYYSLTAVFFDKDGARAETCATQAIKVFGDREGSLVRETYWALGAYLSIIPGTLPKKAGHDFRQRRRLLPASQYVDLSFLYGHRQGSKVNQHLGKEYLLLLETSDKTPYYFNLHDDDLMGLLVFGVPGSGKSVFANTCIDNSMKDDPWMLILDGLGGSFRVLTQKHRGNYFELDPEGDWPFTLNPFLLPDSRKTRQYLSMLLRVCLATGGFRPNAEKSQIIYDEVARVLQLPREERRISSLRLPKNIAIYLAPWIGQGQYSFVFDNAIDSFAMSKLQTIDFSAMEEFPDVLQPLLFHFFYLWNQIVNDPALLTTPKAMWVDEGWKMISYPAARRYIKTAGRTWRKKNGGMALLTQSLVELEDSKLLGIINELCPMKVLLKNPGGDFDLYAKVFKLNESELDKYRSLSGKGDMLVKTPKWSKALRNRLSGIELATYANDPYMNAKRDAAIAQYGFEEGLKVLAKGA